MAAEVLEQGRLEAGSMIGDYLPVTTIPRYPSIEQGGGDRHRFLISDGVGLCPFGEVVDNGEYVAVAVLRHGVGPGDVDSKAFHRFAHEEGL